LAGDLYVLGAEVDLPHGADVAALQQRLDAVGSELSVEISLRGADADVL
jgi:glycine cleavage system transcriptional repressor